MAIDAPGAASPGTPNPNQDTARWLDWPKIFQSLLTAAILALAGAFWQVTTENQRQNYQLQQHEQRWERQDRRHEVEEQDAKATLKAVAQLEQAVKDLTRRLP